MAAGADGGTAWFVGAGSWIWARASSTTVERPRSDLAPGGAGEHGERPGGAGVAEEGAAGGVGIGRAVGSHRSGRAGGGEQVAGGGHPEEDPERGRAGGHGQDRGDHGQAGRGQLVAGRGDDADQAEGGEADRADPGPPSRREPSAAPISSEMSTMPTIRAGLSPVLKMLMAVRATSPPAWSMNALPTLPTSDWPLPPMRGDDLAHGQGHAGGHRAGELRLTCGHRPGRRRPRVSFSGQRISGHGRHNTSTRRMRSRDDRSVSRRPLSSTGPCRPHRNPAARPPYLLVGRLRFRSPRRSTPGKGPGCPPRLPRPSIGPSIPGPPRRRTHARSSGSTGSRRSRSGCCTCSRCWPSSPASRSRPWSCAWSSTTGGCSSSPPGTTATSRTAATGSTASGSS